MLKRTEEEISKVKEQWTKILSAGPLITTKVAKELQEKSRKIRKEYGFRVLLKKHSKKEENERKGWEELSQQNIAKIWDNPKDEAAWKKYL